MEQCVPVEEHDVEPIPAEQQAGGTWGLRSVWFVVGLSMLSGTAAATLVYGLGLNAWQATLAGGLGVLATLVVAAILAVLASRTGTPALVLSRAAFGVRGNLLPAIVAWASVTLFAAVIVGGGARRILHVVGTITDADSTAGADLPALAIATVALVGTLAVLVAVWGQRVLTLVTLIGGVVFGLLTLASSAFLLEQVGVSSALEGQAAPVADVVTGVMIVFVTGSIWVIGGDVARHQPRSTSARSLTKTIIGYAGIPAIMLLALGALRAAAAISDNPDASTQALTLDPGSGLPMWVQLIYAGAVLGASVLFAGVLLYSCGLIARAAGSPLSRARSTVVTAAVAAGAAGVMLIGDVELSLQLQTAAVVVGIVVLVWLGVVLVDLLARQELDPDALVSADREAPYFYSRGFHLPGLLAWVTGMAAAALFVEIPTRSGPDLAGPLAHTLVGEYGIGWLIAFTAGAGAYAAFGGTQAERRRVLRLHREKQEYRAEQRRLRWQAKEEPASEDEHPQQEATDSRPVLGPRHWWNRRDDSPAG